MPRPPRPGGGGAPKPRPAGEPGLYHARQRAAAGHWRRPVRECRRSTAARWRPAIDAERWRWRAVWGAKARRRRTEARAGRHPGRRKPARTRALWRHHVTRPRHRRRRLRRRRRHRRRHRWRGDGAAPRASRSTPIAAGDWARIGCSLTHDPSAANRVTPPGEVAPGAIAPGERKDAGGPRRRPRLLSGVGGGMMGVGSVCGGSIDPGGSMSARHDRRRVQPAPSPWPSPHSPPLSRGLRPGAVDRQSRQTRARRT